MNIKSEIEIKMEELVPEYDFSQNFQSLWLKVQLQQNGSTLQCFRISSKYLNATSVIRKLEDNLRVPQVKPFLSPKF
ncbi:UNVERIFIED_CONTAM: hypothetical protein RMT77_014946 [Armadillidium vulgare]